MKFLDKRLDRRIAAYQQELIETHYREVENMYRQMRGWRHDFRNHIQLLAAYAQKGDLEAVKSYLAELEQDLARVEPTVKTGNAMADAILNSKISLAKTKGIPVRADAHIPQNGGCGGLQGIQNHHPPEGNDDQPGPQPLRPGIH